MQICQNPFDFMVVTFNSYNNSVHQYLEGIEGAAEDEQAIVAQRGDHTQVSGVANEVDLADAGVVMDHLWRQGRKQGMPVTQSLARLLQAFHKHRFLFQTTMSYGFKYVTTFKRVGSTN